MPLRILGSRIDAVTSQDALDRIRGFLRSDHPHHIITGNTLMLLSAEKDAELRQILENAALVVPESSGILWASRILGNPLTEFIPGVDLMMMLCDIVASITSSSPTVVGGGSIRLDRSPTESFRDDNMSVFLLGSKPGIAEHAARVIKQRYPHLTISGTEHGYFSTEERPTVIEHVRSVKPTVLFVGMGMPAQEKWIARHLDTLGVPVVMGVGGSFDVLSGKLSRAPAWMRRLGVEWMYRLVQEPWRWRRIAQLPVFAWKVFWQRGIADRRSTID